MLEDSVNERDAALQQVSQLEGAVDHLIEELTAAIEYQAGIQPHQRRMLEQLLLIEISRIEQLQGSGTASQQLEQTRERIRTIEFLLSSSNQRQESPPKQKVTRHSSGGQ